MKKKWLITGISTIAVILLILTSLSNVIGYQTVQSSNEKVTIKISYSTLRNVEQVEKDISLQDSQHLSSLMNGSDNEALAFELMKLGLVPSSMNLEQLKELISGEYGKKEFAFANKVLNKDRDIGKFNGTKRNFFCNVQGDAADSYALFTPVIFFTFIGIGEGLFALYQVLLNTFPRIFPIFRIPFMYESVGILALLGLLFIILPNALIIFYQNPSRKQLFFYADISDDRNEQKANFSTQGLLGSWSIQSYGIDLFFIGFVGIWMIFNDHYNSPAVNFKGFSLYTVARTYK
jgi:hypothetical protein